MTLGKGGWRTNGGRTEILQQMAPNDDDEPWSGLLGAFCHHIVSLSWLDVRIGRDGTSGDADTYDPKAFSVSAFVISVRNVWFLVTAGHILSRSR